MVSPGASVRPCYMGMMFLFCTSRRGSPIKAVWATTARSLLYRSHSSVASSSSSLSPAFYNNQQRIVHNTAWINLFASGRQDVASLNSGSRRMFRSRRIPAIAAWTTATNTDSSATIAKRSLPIPSLQRLQALPKNKLLIQWKGEAREGYSLEFRQLEFMCALEAVVAESSNLPSSSLPPMEFTDALVYAGSRENMTDYHVEGFNQAFQYLHYDSNIHHPPITLWHFRLAVERCALVRALYEVVATADTVQDLAPVALAKDTFVDIQQQPRQLRKQPTGEVHPLDESLISWCVRVRHFHESTNFDDESSLSSTSSSSSTARKERRYGDRTSFSFTMEQPVLKALTPLLLTFGGRVDLQSPDCKIYVLDGMEPNKCKMLAREIAKGPKISFIAPATRICVTTTPLCPIAAFLLCNVAKIRDGDAVLDPFAGSCTTLLAATMMAPNCRTVGIEIAHNGEVNRDDVLLDFNTRNFQPPVAFIRGDCTESSIRDKARAAIESSRTSAEGAFDVIVTDPPYGIREKMNDSAAGLPTTPLEALFSAVAEDRRAGKPLLKPGGRLVAYCPCRPFESLMEILPTAEQAADAGLVLSETREQRIRDTLSRWLVAYTSLMD